MSKECRCGPWNYPKTSQVAHADHIIGELGPLEITASGLDTEQKLQFHSHCRDPKEMVNHPQHYGGEDNPYEVIKIIEAHKLGFNLGNAIKYILRAEHKGKLKEDLKKAIWYLERHIENANL